MSASTSAENAKSRTRKRIVTSYIPASVHHHGEHQRRKMEEEEEEKEEEKDLELTEMIEVRQEVEIEGGKSPRKVAGGITPHTIQETELREYREMKEEMSVKTTQIKTRENWKKQWRDVRSYRRGLTGRKGREQVELEKISLKEEKVATWTSREIMPEESTPENLGTPEKAEMDTEP